MMSAGIKLGFLWNEIPPVAKLLPMVLQFLFLFGIEPCSPIRCPVKGQTGSAETEQNFY